MRLKIILPNAVVLLLVGILSYFTVRQSLTTGEDIATLQTSVERQASGAAGIVQLQLLRTERWLAEQGNNDFFRERLQNPSLEDKNRREKTTEQLDTLRRVAGETKSIFIGAPDIAALINKEGKAVGRSEEIQTYHGEDFGVQYPSLMQAIQEGRTGSDVWLASKFTHKHFVSYAPVRDRDRNVLGVIALAWALTDQRMMNLSEGTTAFVVLEGNLKQWLPKVYAKANESVAPSFAQEIEISLKDHVFRAFRNGIDVQPHSNGTLSAIVALTNVGNGQHAAIAVARRATTFEHPEKILWPIVTTTGVGLLFIIIIGFIVGNYITSPIDKIEETLFQIINGNANQRIQLEHAELGGLTFCINQLLNTMFGVEESETDDDGRPSSLPSQEHFREALSVETSAKSVDATTLAAKSEDMYYQHLYEDYIKAKQSNGEAVEGITFDIFTKRIKMMEQENAQKLNKPVRYAVQVREQQVILLAIPLE